MCVLCVCVWVCVWGGGGRGAIISRRAHAHAHAHIIDIFTIAYAASAYICECIELYGSEAALHRSKCRSYPSVCVNVVCGMYMW